MGLQFSKFHGTGNDFIMVDGTIRENIQFLEIADIQSLCDRHFGIGADGLIILEESKEADFRMVYFNSDGKTSTMCGNGGRCAAIFARQIGLSKEFCTLMAADGLHHVRIINEKWVELSMNDVREVRQIEAQTFILDTGSPHYVRFGDKTDLAQIVEFGKKIRYSDTYRAEGINVNLACVVDEAVHIRTYERGVEDETLSCGTGVTAVAMCAHILFPQIFSNNKLILYARGGKLVVSCTRVNETFTDVWLGGHAEKVFDGNLDS